MSNKIRAVPTRSVRTMTSQSETDHELASAVLVERLNLPEPCKLEHEWSSYELTVHIYQVVACLVARCASDATLTAEVLYIRRLGTVHLMEAKHSAYVLVCASADDSVQR